MADDINLMTVDEILDHLRDKRGLCTVLGYKTKDDEHRYVWRGCGVTCLGLATNLQKEVQDNGFVDNG